MMTTNEIRKKFLAFFESKGHTVVASDSVVPKDDPTVLFTTAGMQQFKRQFLGNIDNYTKAATSQKCIRTDDLDQVGETAFHHTFFEMLGNFSFGDYFKKEAINWAWEFLTKEVNIPSKKLWVSVYKDDEEAEKIWLEDIKIPTDRLVKLGDKSNFWPSDAKASGPNGPCGPCSEIFYDYGENASCTNANCNPDCDCGRFSEVWNLVFTQFNRKEGGILEHLPNCNIDTGMGLERLAAVVQGKTNNFETDLFAPILEFIDKEAEQENIRLDKKQRFVIADHIRAIVFAIGDGVIPSNKERGFVVKRLITDVSDMILQKKGKSFVHKLVPAVVDAMKEAYPELIKRMNETASYIKKVEEDYLKVFETRIPELRARTKAIFEVDMSKEKQLEQLGTEWFTFRDRYGLTMPTIVATSTGIVSLDMVDTETAKIHTEKLFKKQREQSRAGSKMAGDVFTNTELDLNVPKTAFLGHDNSETKSKIIKLFRENKSVDQICPGESIQIVLDQTPFYAESGGQIGDTGIIRGENGKVRIDDTAKVGDVFLHIGVVEEGILSINDTVDACINQDRRLSIMRFRRQF